jgi:hypothetical protein
MTSGRGTFVVPEIGAVDGPAGAALSGVTATAGPPSAGGVVPGIAGAGAEALLLARLLFEPAPPPPPQAARVLPNTAIAAIRIA